MTKKRLIIFVKNPIEGEVKTRLASSIGEKKALVVYQQLLKITAKAVEGVNAEKLVSYSGYIEESDDFDEQRFEKTIQKEGDLGEKMKHAFKSSFDNGVNRTVLIGSDCPEISKSLIDEAFKELAEADSVIGPSEDGGYYLIGLSRYIPEIFDDVEWSTSSVFSSTIKALDDLGAIHCVLKKLNDIDTESDLNESDLLI